jgi:3-oxoacyl-(acyl-carrier-protein) synthase III
MTPRLAVATPARGATLLGLGAYRPARVVTNEEICLRIDSSDEWIRSRSGIERRRFAAADETVASMATQAAERALAAAELTPADVDTVLVATATHLLQTPAAAVEVASGLGCGPVAAFDLSAACAGFCYGVAMASDLVRAGTARHVLVVGSEKLSLFTDPEDRGTAFIFADGAGAVVIGPADDPGIGPVVWGSATDGRDLIKQTLDWESAYARDEGPVWPVLEMQGNQVFRWASFAMAKVALQAVEAAGITLDQLDAFVPHQANMRITDAMARSMKLPSSVAIARDIADQGNTSAASVPLALERLVADGELRSGGLALTIGFGAGLVYAAQVVRLP